MPSSTLICRRFLIWMVSAKMKRHKTQMESSNPAMVLAERGTFSLMIFGMRYSSSNHMKRMSRRKLKPSIQSTWLLNFLPLPFDLSVTGNFFFMGVPIIGRRSSDSFENKRGVDAAEGEVVRHDILGFQFARAVHDVIEIGAAWIDVGKIQRGRDPIVAHHLDGHPGFEGAACAERVAEITFQGRNGHPPSEDIAGRGRFGD